MDGDIRMEILRPRKSLLSDHFGACAAAVVQEGSFLAPLTY